MKTTSFTVLAIAAAFTAAFGQTCSYTPPSNNPIISTTNPSSGGNQTPSPAPVVQPPDIKASLCRDDPTANPDDGLTYQDV